MSHDASRRARKRVQVHVRRSIRVGFQAAVDPSRFGRAKVCANGRLGRNRIAGLQREEDVLGLPHGGGSGLRIFRMAAHGGRDRGVAAVEQLAGEPGELRIAGGLRDHHVGLPV